MLRRIAGGIGVTAALIASMAVAPTATAAGGTLAGFTNADFTYLNALDTTAGNLGQLTLSQSAAAASTGDLTTKNTLGENVLDKSAKDANAYGHGAGVSANLGSPPGSIPQIRLTQAEATSPPPSKDETNLVDVPADPLAHATVLPSTAAANTRANTGSPEDFCPTIGGPISLGRANVAASKVLPTDNVAPGFALIDQDSAVHNRSALALASNGELSHFGLAAASTLSTAGLTLFKGVDGAETTIKVVNPVTLEAFAAGIPGKSSVHFGDQDGNVPVVSISNGTNTAVLTLNDLLGNGVTIALDGLLEVTIALKPDVKKLTDTEVSATADLVKVKVIGGDSPVEGHIDGGPLAQLNQVLDPVFSALNDAGIFQAINDALVSGGINTAADLRVGHFEATAQVPAGGVECTIPVHKVADPPTVTVGDDFVYNITVDNPFSCPLDPVTVTDTISGDPGVKWSVTGTDPKADKVSDNEVIWNNIGPIPSKGSKKVSISVHVANDSGPGVFVDKAVAKGICHGEGTTGNTTITLHGHVTVTTPRVEGEPLPNTGNNPWLPITGAALLIAALGGSLAFRVRRQG